MGQILVKRAIDRSRYPKKMLYVDRQGNICEADRPAPLSAEEKASRQDARNRRYEEVKSQRHKLRQAMLKAKREAKKHPTVENAEAYEKANADYQDFRKHGFKIA